MPAEKAKALFSLKSGTSRDEVRKIMGDADSVKSLVSSKKTEEKWQYENKTPLFDSKEDRLKPIR